MMSFNRWLQMKYDRVKKIKPLLALAEDMASDKAFPKSINNVAYLKSYLEGCNASPDYLQAALKLYGQYERELKAQTEEVARQQLENPPVGDSTSEIILSEETDPVKEKDNEESSNN